MAGGRSSDAGATPAAAGILMEQAMASWAVPAVIADLQNASRKAKPRLVPDPKQIQQRLALSCPGFPQCLEAAVRESERRRQGKKTDLSVAAAMACPQDPSKRILVVPMPRHGGTRPHLLVGCVPAPYGSMPAIAKPRGRAPRLTLPLPDDPKDRDRRAFAAALHDLRVRLEKLRSLVEGGERYAETVSRHERELSALIECAGTLVEAPDRALESLNALAPLNTVQAVGHLEVQCGHDGSGVLRHEWFAKRKGRSFERVSNDDSGAHNLTVSLDGALWRRWHRCLPGYGSDSDTLAALRQTGEPLRKYLQRFTKYISGCRYVIIGRLGKNVAPGSCDIDPDCHFIESCRLFAQDCNSTGESECSKCWLKEQCLRRSISAKPADKQERRWRRRLVAVDLLFVEGFAFENRAWMALLQIASLLRHERMERDNLEDALLQGLPTLPQEAQRHYLRYLFDHLRAMDDCQQKGAAFERLMFGLLGLVPGWVPVRRNCRTRENEIDVLLRIEPGEPSARYWYDQYGARVLVECKNYPDGLAPSIGKGKRRVSPVQKLLGVMKKSGTTLGLLLNTGPIPAILWREALATAGKGSLVVPLDGGMLERIIQNPGDIETAFKNRVEEAATGVQPLIS